MVVLFNPENLEISVNLSIESESGMQNHITLSQPLLDQPAVRERLNLGEGNNPTVSLEDMLEVARQIIQTELVKHGYAPTELIGLRISYGDRGEVDNQEKTLSREWESLSNPTEAINAQDSAKLPPAQLPVDHQFLSDLGGRLKEIMPTTASESDGFSMLLNFSSSDAIGVGNCDRDGNVKGVIPKVPCLPTSTKPDEVE
jgi:hypothetical protein